MELRIQNSDLLSQKMEEIIAKENIDDKKPYRYVYASMVYAFTKNLPYSMDPHQEEYVPAEFLNLPKMKSNDEYWFGYDEKDTIYGDLFSWRDTKKTAGLLQIYYIFQMMLTGNFPHEFHIDKNNKESLSIFNILATEEYIDILVNILNDLPTYYNELTAIRNIEERREYLEKIYKNIQTQFAAIDNKKNKTSEFVPLLRNIKMFFGMNYCEYNNNGIEELINLAKESVRPKTLKEIALSIKPHGAFPAGNLIAHSRDGSMEERMQRNLESQESQKTLGRKRIPNIKV